MKNFEPITIAEQGSFMAGGRCIRSKGTVNYDSPLDYSGNTLHGDHASVFYQKPLNSEKLPIVFLHGALSSAAVWSTTPDGREGFDTLFLRKGYSVYLVDQPRRGRAGRSTVDGSVSGQPDDQILYHIWRLGKWPALREGSQFPEGSEAMDQFLRWICPNTGAFDQDVISDAVASIFDRTGDGILVTHSQGGGPGWQTALKNEKVRAIVAFEPLSGFPFPEGEVPKPIPSISPFGALKAAGVPEREFQRFTKVPIRIYYGDYIPRQDSKDWPEDHWRAGREMAERFAETVNRHGGDAEVVSLPDIGMTGNSHFLFADKNNADIADNMAEWLKSRNM